MVNPKEKRTQARAHANTYGECSCAFIVRDLSCGPIGRAHLEPHR